MGKQSWPTTTSNIGQLLSSDLLALDVHFRILLMIVRDLSQSEAPGVQGGFSVLTLDLPSREYLSRLAPSRDFSNRHAIPEEIADSPSLRASKVYLKF